jgi:hypothetical protein
MTDKLVLTPEDDGKTHINIYSQGKTQLGKDLSNFAHTPFIHKEHGAFASVEGYWYWLSCQNDDLRHVYGYKAKEMGQSMPAVKRWHPEKFHSLICDALTAKLERHPQILKALVDTTLPLTHYYAKYYGGKLKVTTPSGGDFILAHFEKIRAEHNPEADCSTMQRMGQRKVQQEATREAQDSQLGLF